MKSTLLIVPHDFTSVGQKALEYAIYIGKNIDVEIHLVHIVGKEALISDAQHKLDAIIAETPTKSNVSFSSNVIIGNIFSDIGKYAEENKALLVIMGTHGMKGTQRIFGSFAMKVIDSTKVPFLIVQEDTILTEIKHIAAFIDTNNESIQIIGICSYISAILGAKISILYEKVTDIAFRNRINIHKGIITDSCERVGAEFEFVELGDSKSTLGNINKFMNNSDSDMIAISNYSESLFKQFDTFSQNLITNKLSKPCLIINATETSNSYF